MRAAASSIASGIPSSRRQIAPAIGAAAVVQKEPPVQRLRPRHEQLDRGRVQHILVLLAALRGHLKREHPVDVLPRRAQRLAAGRQHSRVRIGAQQRRGHAGRRLDHVLAIVQHDQETLGGHGRRHPLGRFRAGECEPESHRDRGRHQPRIRQRRELGHPHPVRVARQVLPRDLQAQPRLADTTRPDQRDEPVDAEQLRHLRERGIPADQLRCRRRQVRRRRGLRQRCHRRGQKLGEGPVWAISARGEGTPRPGRDARRGRAGSAREAGKSRLRAARGAPASARRHRAGTGVTRPRGARAAQRAA